MDLNYLHPCLAVRTSQHTVRLLALQHCGVSVVLCPHQSLVSFYQDLTSLRIVLYACQISSDVDRP